MGIKCSGITIFTQGHQLHAVCPLLFCPLTRCLIQSRPNAAAFCVRADIEGIQIRIPVWKPYGAFLPVLHKQRYQSQQPPIFFPDIEHAVWLQNRRLNKLLLLRHDPPAPGLELDHMPQAAVKQLHQLRGVLQICHANSHYAPSFLQRYILTWLCSTIFPFCAINLRR